MDLTKNVYICGVEGKFGHMIRASRQSQGLTLREVADKVGMDPALLSKIERGQRAATHKQVGQLSAVLAIALKDLRTQWLADRILQEVAAYPDIAEEALLAAEPRVAYLTGEQRLSMVEVPQRIGERLLKIDKLKALWTQHRPLDEAIKQKMLEYYQVLNSYESNRIEGNTLTLMETELVINQGVTISGKPLAEHMEAINHGHAVRYLQDLVKEQAVLDERVLLQLHQLVLQGINQKYAGRYRDVPVRIGGSEHLPPQPYLVPKMMEDYFIHYHNHRESLHPVVLAAEMHERLVSIHPFVDGNGRTARLVMNLVLLQHGYPIASLKGDVESRQAYYKALEEVQIDSDPTAFYALICDTVEAALHDHLKWVVVDYDGS